MITLTKETAATLREILAAYDNGQRQFPTAVAASRRETPPLRLVRTETDWAVGHEGTASHQTGITQATVLTAGTADDDPLVRLSAQKSITAVSGSTVTITAEEGRVVVGSVVVLTGCGTDDGEHVITAVSASSGSLVMTLEPDLTVTPVGGSVILPEAWGWDTTDAINSVVSRADHRVIPVGRIGHEWHVLGSPAVWVLLDSGLARATSDGTKISISSTQATRMDANAAQDELTESDATLTVSSFDESLSLAAGTLCLARLLGSRWIIIWASCNVSGLRA